MLTLFFFLAMTAFATDVPDSEGRPVPNDFGLISRTETLLLGAHTQSAVTTIFEKAQYPEAYQLIARRLKKIRADHNTTFWFHKAVDINRNRGPSAMMIRNYVIIGLKLIGRTPPDLQKLSDAIAVSVIEDILRTAGVPPLENVLAHDIQKAMSLGGIKDLAGWGGSFYYWRMPMVDVYGHPILDPLGTQQKDFLTIGDTILRDVDQRRRFILTTAEAFKSVDPLTALSDPQGLIEALGTFQKLPELVKKPILDRIFIPARSRQP